MEFVIGGVIVILFAFFMIINIRDMNRFVVREYMFTSDKVNGEFKFAFLSDLHNKRYGKENEKLIKAIDDAAPDALLVGGDMIVASPGKANVHAKKIMEELAEKYPVYYGMGNHEYRSDIYPEKYGDMYPEYTEPLKKQGVVFLRNETASLEEFRVKVRGIEIDRCYYKRFRVYPMDDSYPEELLGEKSDDYYEIMLAHNPDYFKKYAAYGSDLVLSGHVHGGLIRLPFIGGIASPAVRFFPKYNGGLYTMGDTKMIVSCGLGTHTLPLRIFNPAELIIIRIMPACKEDEKQIK